jgi:hypothetical protein
MDWKALRRRKHEIMCEICCSELIGSILESENDEDDKISQILFLVDLVERKAERKERIKTLKKWRKFKIEST